MIQFLVLGRPQQRGSKRVGLIPKRGGGFVTKNGRPIVAARDMNESSKEWMGCVRDAAARAFGNRELLRCPVELSVTFYFSRPQSHYRTGRHAGELKDSAPQYHAKSPDLDKLVRAIGDSLTGVVIADDKLICQLGDCRREWTTKQECAVVTVTPLVESESADWRDQPLAITE